MHLSFFKNLTKHFSGLCLFGIVLFSSVGVFTVSVPSADAEVFNYCACQRNNRSAGGFPCYTVNYSCTQLCALNGEAVLEFGTFEGECADSPLYKITEPPPPPPPPTPIPPPAPAPAPVPPDPAPEPDQISEPEPPPPPLAEQSPQEAIPATVQETQNTPAPGPLPTFTEAPPKGPTILSMVNPLAGAKDVNVIVGRIAKALITLSGALALMAFVWGGLQMMTSGGVSARYEKGKQTLIWATVGLVIIFTAYALVSTVVSVLTSGNL